MASIFWTSAGAGTGAAFGDSLAVRASSAGTRFAKERRIKAARNELHRDTLLVFIRPILLKVRYTRTGGLWWERSSASLSPISQRPRLQPTEGQQRVVQPATHRLNQTPGGTPR